jgi:hypothetical protein
LCQGRLRLATHALAPNPQPGNCEYPAGSWQLKYCFETQKKCSPAFAPDNFFASVAGDASAADVLKAAGVLLAPFDFLPGKQYHYR